MDMDFTPEQELLRESLRRACARHASFDEVRKLENDPVGYSPAFWTVLGDVGVHGLMVPEEYGGSGMSLLDGVVAYEELGRALAPSPHFVSAVLAAGAIARSPHDDLRARWLPPLASGEAVVAVAWLEADGGFGPGGITASARPDGDGWRISGIKRHVQFARAADALLTLARGPDGIVAVLVDPTAAGVTLEQQLTVASDPQFRVRLDDVRVEPDAVVDTRVGAQAGAWQSWHETMLRGAVLLGAQAVGGAQASLELAVDYAKSRRQFDKPLAAFQAIGHYLADATTAVDGAQTLVWEAGWAVTAGRSLERLAPMAKLFAGRTFRDVTATAHQIFGGAGFTVELDIQLFFRRAKALQLNWWDDRHLEELIAADLLAG
jgi:alkylation response protein AidB-like acyl-CoA dehydrogenase